MGEGEREVEWVGEGAAKGKVLEGGRDGVEFLVEHFAECEVGNRGREVVNRVVKAVSE